MTSTLSDRAAAELFKYLNNDPCFGEILYEFNKKSKTELIHDLSSIIQASTHCNTIAHMLDTEICLIQSDTRYPHEPSQDANVFVNAPLALIQMGMKGKVSAYKHALILLG
jgi:recombinational DNA repair protein RecR